MTTRSRGATVFGSVTLLVLGLILCGCPSEPQGPPDQPTTPVQPPDETSTSAAEPAGQTSQPSGVSGTAEPGDGQSAEPLAAPGADETSMVPSQPAAEPELPAAAPEPPLGEPLVDKPEALKRLDPDKPLWLDPEGKQVVMIGRICQTEAPLEMFACLKNTKEHEAIVAVDVEAFKVHAGLLAIGAKAGTPVRWDPEYVPATGETIDVIVRWKDQSGTMREVRAQDWIRDTKTEKAMEHRWVFAGSGFWEEPDTGKKYYQAEGGDFICVSNFSSAMLDLPIESSQANAALLFEAFTERIPPKGTPVTLLLKPKGDFQPTQPPPAMAEPSDQSKPADEPKPADELKPTDEPKLAEPSQPGEKPE